MSRDFQRSRVYRAESALSRMLERVASAGEAGGTVELHGARLWVELELRLGSLEAAQAYVERVLAHPEVTARWPRAAVAVAVRARRGQGRATYHALESGGPTIALPLEESWALRESVILHEIAHHLLAEEDVVAHGAEFARTMLELCSIILSPETAHLLRVSYHDHDVEIQGPREAARRTRASLAVESGQ